MQISQSPANIHNQQCRSACPYKQFLWVGVLPLKRPYPLVLPGTRSLRRTASHNLPNPQTPHHFEPISFCQMNLFKSLIQALLDPSQPTDLFLSKAKTIARRALRLPHFRFHDQIFPPHLVQLCVFAHLSQISLETVHNEYSNIMSQPGSSEEAAPCNLEHLKNVWNDGWNNAADQLGLKKEEQDEKQKKRIFHSSFIFFIPNLLFSNQTATLLLSRISQHDGQGIVLANGEKGFHQANAAVANHKSKQLYIVADPILLKKYAHTTEIPLRPARWLSDSIRDLRIKPPDLYPQATPTPKATPVTPACTSKKRPFSVAGVHDISTLPSTRKRRRLSTDKTSVTKKLFTTPTRVQDIARNHTSAVQAAPQMNWACEVRTAEKCDYPMNEKICVLLGILQENYAIKKDHFRALGYQRAIAKIRTLRHEILTVDDAKATGKEKAIGVKMERKIVEIVSTGRLQQAEAVLENPQNLAVKIFCDVWGVGPVKAMNLVAHGYKSIEELRQAVKQEPSLLDKNQTIGLRLYEHLLRRIPRKEVAELEMYTRKVVKNIDTALNITVAGSYLRGKASCGDVDIMIHGPTDILRRAFPRIKDAMRKSGVLTDDLIDGHDKYFGVFKFPGRPHGRIDLFPVPEEEFPFALLTYTGSAIFNRFVSSFTLSICPDSKSAINLLFHV